MHYRLIQLLELFYSIFTFSGTKWGLRMRTWSVVLLVKLPLEFFCEDSLNFLWRVRRIKASEFVKFVRLNLNIALATTKNVSENAWKLCDFCVLGTSTDWDMNRTRAEFAMSETTWRRGVVYQVRNMRLSHSSQYSWKGWKKACSYAFCVFLVYKAEQRRWLVSEMRQGARLRLLPRRVIGLHDFFVSVEKSPIPSWISSIFAACLPRRRHSWRYQKYFRQVSLSTRFVILTCRENLS